VPEDGGLIDQALIDLKPVTVWVHTYTKPQTSSTRSRGLGWRIHESVEDTKLSTNKQHTTRWSGIHIRTVLSTVSATRLPLFTTHDLYHVLPPHCSMLLVLFVFVFVCTMAGNALHGRSHRLALLPCLLPRTVILCVARNATRLAPMRHNTCVPRCTAVHRGVPRTCVSEKYGGHTRVQRTDGYGPRTASASSTGAIPVCPLHMDTQISQNEDLKMRRVPSPNRYIAVAKFCFCKNNKRLID